MSEFAGLLRERITIEKRSTERDAMGLQVAEWVQLCSCLASIKPDGTGSQVVGQTMSALQRFRVTIRARDGVAIDQRIRWKGRVLSIVQWLDDPRSSDRIELRCEEVRA